ncbi:type IV toxin-antitoxin system AbiEi family antitoxin domain-containing protein [Protaetiibacter intestinalis]|uniref:DUF559 domain-containing protein n=1 Tax=Protaetiibacter intestinalis TaxID=2419774 RepID=A0A387BAQ7_9MICO|nr:type IV toxin-antitoxin system AbiEi family antitoxin domain-containing protein [Protaetiibacter intestinalis]AYF98215.1 DUF559 domain-containing protein [Protaetiibacter intestinalis]
MEDIPRLIRSRELVALGWSRARIRAAEEGGQLVRLRRGAFGPASLDQDCRDAARMRGRLTGVSALRRAGVFVLAADRLHVHVPPSAARLTRIVRPHRLSRRALIRNPHPDALVVEVIDALHDAVLSQPPRAAVATIDSALHLGLLPADDLDELFATLPRRYRRLRRLIDARAESGPETFVRLILRALGWHFDCQVQIDGVGRVDFLVDGWLIIECDSQAYHSDWDAQRRDRRRDLAAAAQGFVTLRVIAEDVLWHSERVRAALVGVVARPTSRKQGR